MTRVVEGWCRGEGMVYSYHLILQVLAQALVDHQIGKEIDDGVILEGNERSLQHSQPSLRLQGPRKTDVMANFVRQDRFDGPNQVLGQDQVRIQGNLARQQVDLGDARLRGIGDRLAQQEKPRPVGLGQRPAAHNFLLQALALFASVGGAIHVAVSTIQSFCELTAQAATKPAWTWSQR